MKKEGASLFRNIFLITFLVILIAVGAWFVLSVDTAHTITYVSNNTDNTDWTQGGAPVNYTMTVTNAGTGTDEDIQCVQISYDSDFTYTSCVNTTGWSCAKQTGTVVQYITTDTNLTPLSSIIIAINGTAQATTGAMTFQSYTFSDSGCSLNTSGPTSTELQVDATAPTGANISATDGTNTLNNESLNTSQNSLFKDAAITITVNITESGSGFKNVTIFFANDSVPTRDSTTKVAMTSLETVENGTRAYTGTIGADNVSDYVNISFFILAIDNVLNEVYLNLSSGDPFNFTIDGSEPTISTSNVSLDHAYNMTNSSNVLFINVSVVDAHEISSVKLVGEIEQSMSNTTASQWNISVSMATICPSLIGADNSSCTLYFNATDSVGNINTSITDRSINLTIYVDDVGPIIENATINDTDFVVLNNFTRFNISVDTQNSISSVAAYTSSNLSSMTRGGGNGWYIINADLNSTFGCQDNTSCAITFNATDVLGRSSYTNLTLWADSVEPALYDARVNDTDAIVKSTDSIQFKVNVSDVSNFTISYVNISNSTDQNASTMVRLTSEDTATTTVYQINTTMSAFGLTADGTYTLHFNATDKAGNDNGTTISITIDDTEPTLSDANTNDSDNKVRPDDSLNITVTATDANSISTLTLRGDSGIEVGMTNYSAGNVWYNDTLNISYLCSGTSGTNGNCTLYFNATDAAGNINVTNLTVEWDDINPIAYGASPNGSTLNNNSVAVSITISDNGTGISNTTTTPIYISVNGTTSYNSTNDSIVTWDGTTLTLTPNASLVFPDGANTITVNATDTVGNSLSTSWTFTIDTTGPTVGSLNVGPNPLANTTLLTVTANATDDVGINASVVYIDDPSYQNTTMTANDGTFGGVSEYVVGDVDLTKACGLTDTLCAEGAHMAFVKVKDQGGTWSAVTSTTFYINSTAIDTTAPSSTGTAPKGLITDNTPILYFNTSENATCKFDSSDVAFASMIYNMTASDAGTEHNYTFSTALNDSELAGNYVYYVRCNDTKGNTMTVSSFITFVLDTDGNFNYTQWLKPIWDTLLLPDQSIMQTMGYSDFNISLMLGNDRFLDNNPYIEVYYYNGTTWAGYSPATGWAGSDLKYVNNTNDDPYWIKLNITIVPVKTRFQI